MVGVKEFVHALQPRLGTRKRLGGGHLLKHDRGAGDARIGLSVDEGLHGAHFVGHLRVGHLHVLANLTPQEKDKENNRREREK